MARPPKYSTKEQLEAVISLYLAECLEKQKLPTKSGACLALDITRETWGEYKKKDEFSYTLKRLENQIEEAWVQRLTTNAPTGAIFYLKNAFKEEYKDRTETDHTTKGDKLIFMPPEILKKHALDTSSGSKSDSRG